MKTSNLLGILALGGIGYYLLKNKKTQLITSPLTSKNEGQSIVNTTPVVTTPVVTTPIVTTPIVTTSVVNNASPKIEEALAPLKVVELTSTGQPLFQPPVNTTWVNPPASLDTKGSTNTSFGYTTQQSVDANPDIALLIKNPSIKSKNNYYIDQYGNLIQAPTKVFPDGVLIETAKRIEEWRKANGVTS